MSALTASLKAQCVWLVQPGAVANLDEIVNLADDFYALPDNGAGGLLHVVLDDGNIRADVVEYCREAARKAGDEPAFYLAQVLLLLTEEQRDVVVGGNEPETQ